MDYNEFNDCKNIDGIKVETDTCQTNDTKSLLKTIKSEPIDDEECPGYNPSNNNIADGFVRICKEENDERNVQPETSQKFNCRFCDLIFSHLPELENHIQTHNPEEPYECMVCFQKFSFVSSLRNHQMTHNETFSDSSLTSYAETLKNSEEDTRKYTCTLCNEIIISTQLFKLHLYMHENKRRIHSGHNKKIGLSYEQSYSVKEEPKELFECENCKEKFILKTGLEVHVRSCSAISECRPCNKKFSDVSEYKKHLQFNHEGKKIYECTFCKIIFSDVYEWKKHIFVRYHREIECEYCEKKFASVRTLQIHYRSHEKKMYPCEICGKLFQFEKIKKKHVYTHSFV